MVYSRRRARLPLPAVSSLREPRRALAGRKSLEVPVVNYYDILKVKRTASAAEIKSAYRKLARERHPDVNGGTDAASREFARISLAYRILSDPQERAYHDAQLTRLYSGDFRGSIIHSSNQHAQRLRRIVATQRRFDRRVDELIAEDRRENFALQQTVFTTVTLFLSTFFVAWFKPPFWYNFHIVGRAVVVTLFAIGLWHLAVRLKAYFEHYTYKPKSIHDSLINADAGEQDKPFTRFTASTFLIVGSAISLSGGLHLASLMQYFVIFKALPYFFGDGLRPPLFLPPPIAVLIVDTMHTVASKID